MQPERRLYFVSDTHHEMRKDSKKAEIDIIPEPNVTADNYLALCGDIGNPFNPNYEKFIRRHAQRFRHVFIVAGNHEYYSNQKQRPMSDIEAKIYEIALLFDNVSFLQQDTFQIGNTTVAGCTLWTAVTQAAEQSMNDYSRIYIDSEHLRARKVTLHAPFSTFAGMQKQKYVRAQRRLVRWSDIRELHEEMKSWLINLIDTTTEQLIVLTHHAPSMSMIGKKNLVEPNSMLSPSRQDAAFPMANCYASACDHLCRPPVIAWISGHTHVCLDLHINGIPSVSNCYGYPGQKTGVDTRKFIVF